MARAGGGAPRELSLEEVLKCYEQPLNEEQAWALCFQSCRAAPAGPAAPLRTADIRLRGDGSVVLPAPPPGERAPRRGVEPAARGGGAGIYRHLPALTGTTGTYRYRQGALRRASEALGGRGYRPRREDRDWWRRTGTGSGAWAGGTARGGEAGTSITGTNGREPVRHRLRGCGTRETVRMGEMAGTGTRRDGDEPQALAR